MTEECEKINKAYFICKTDPRRRKTETLIMKLFVHEKKHSLYPKKEYVRCKVIRGHKKIIRMTIHGKNPKKGIVFYNQKDKSELKSFRLFQDHLNENLEELGSLSLAESGPLTDGKSKRTAEPVRNERDKSFNNNFCKNYFTSNTVRVSFVLFMRLVFTHMVPDELRKKFGF